MTERLWILVLELREIWIQDLERTYYEAEWVHVHGQSQKWEGKQIAGNV